MLLLGAGPQHFSLQPSLQLGVAFRTGRRLTMIPAVRIGYALIRVGMPVGWRTAHDVVTSGSCEFRFDLWQRWRLGVTPLALTVYLPDPWGAVLEPQLALLHDF